MPAVVLDMEPTKADIDNIETFTGRENGFHQEVIEYLAQEGHDNINGGSGTKGIYDIR